MQVEYHQLVLRYEHLRMRCPQQERRLLASLAEHGQQTPIVVVEAGEPERFVVVDGYKRVRAMRRLGCDTLQAACWDLGEAEALLLGRLMRAGGEHNAFEQGLWLKELHMRFALSLEELARRFDRSTSWVSRRLALVRDLPEGVQKRVLAGELVAHAAMKYLVPLARANRAECEQLSEAIAGRQLTTRQVGELVAAQTRAVVLADPLLVLKARAEAIEPRLGEGQSCCGDLLRDFEVVASVARRAHKRLCEGAAVRLAAAEREDLSGSFRQAQRAMERLAAQMNKEMEDAGRVAAHGHP
jgi:ParB/RepB/Spo0J family partition protein